MKISAAGQTLRAPTPNTVGDCFVASCPSRVVLSHVTGRWGVLIIAALRERRTLRFSELRLRVDGISEKMLAQRLRELERDGLLTRRSYPVVPPHVEYALTPAGLGVAMHLQALIDWIDMNVRDVLVSQQAYDAGPAHADHDRNRQIGVLA